MSYVSKSPLLSKVGKCTSYHSVHLHVSLQGVDRGISVVVAGVVVEMLVVSVTTVVVGGSFGVVTGVGVVTGRVVGVVVCVVPGVDAVMPHGSKLQHWILI